jgi:hypothetical protein
MLGDVAGQSRTLQDAELVVLSKWMRSPTRRGGVSSQTIGDPSAEGSCDWCARPSCRCRRRDPQSVIDPVRFRDRRPEHKRAIDGLPEAKQMSIKALGHMYCFGWRLNGGGQVARFCAE